MMTAPKPNPRGWSLSLNRLNMMLFLQRAKFQRSLPRSPPHRRLALLDSREDMSKNTMSTFMLCFLGSKSP